MKVKNIFQKDYIHNGFKGGICLDGGVILAIQVVFIFFLLVNTYIKVKNNPPEQQ